jgi:hypothetical protein
MTGRAVAAGVVLGIVYTMSPLTVLMLPLLVIAARFVGRELSPHERKWLYGVLFFAVAVRLAAIAGLFLLADNDRPFATFFGDEEMFKSRSIWLRNIGLGVPISAADFIYAVEETGKSQYLFLLAYMTALVGDAPYSVHVFNTVLYLIGVLALYRIVRQSFGGVVAFGGLIVLLFLPSLFIWSISALKEPLYTLLAVAELACVLQIARSRSWSGRIASIAGVVAIAFLLEGLRKGGLLVAGIGAAGGLAAGFIVSRPRLLLAALVTVPSAAVIALSMPALQERFVGIVREAAIYHVGHIFTPGYSYRTLDSWYYIDPADIRRMPVGDGVAFVLRSVAGYITQPLPWAIESRAMLVYLPEYVVWLTLVALVPVGFIAGLRRDAILTCVLAAHGLALMLIVALTSGNVGTLIRHRGLALPYFVWLSALGAYRLLQRTSAPVVAVRGEPIHAHR